eukprot:TRINITY_DN34498_c0_g1_i1.p1 TRINITY_DN34498_c0_g1~~TRINITY_DN34498_c0_g1_i1.p1  ORF type:complete len:125 (+),score=18.08 TRINITY_DN34498_c0_g1_i1:246-620(+)
MAASRTHGSNLEQYREIEVMSANIATFAEVSRAHSLRRLNGESSFPKKVRDVCCGMAAQGILPRLAAGTRVEEVVRRVSSQAATRGRFLRCVFIVIFDVPIADHHTSCSHVQPLPLQKGAMYHE